MEVCGSGCSSHWFYTWKTMRIDAYPNDNNIQPTDKLIGTDAQDNRKTKNFRISDLMTYLANGLSLTSIYDLWLAAGNSGTPSQFLATLVGDSAYEVAVENGFEGNETEWLASLVGEQGPMWFNFHGVWVPGTEYSVNDLVSFDNALYFCIVNTSGTVNPETNTTDWTPLNITSVPAETESITATTGPSYPVISKGIVLATGVVGGRIKLPALSDRQDGESILVIQNQNSFNSVAIYSNSGNEIYPGLGAGPQPDFELQRNQSVRFTKYTPVAGISYWLPEVLKTKKPYLEFRSRIIQSETGDPQLFAFYLDEFRNTSVPNTDRSYRDIVFGRVSTGLYRVRFRVPLAVTAIQNLEVDFPGAKVKCTGSLVGTDGTTFNYYEIGFETRDDSGNLADGQFPNAWFKATIFI